MIEYAGAFGIDWIAYQVDTSAFDPTPVLKALESSFNISCWTLIPLFVALILAVRRVPVFVVIMAGALMGDVTAIFLNIFAGDQYMALVLLGTIFREEFKKCRIAPRMLSRQMEDTATFTSPLVPWKTCGAYMAATLGVTTIAYLPYCFFNLINPVLSLIFDAIGFQIKLLTAEKTGETEPSELEKIDHYGVGGFEVDQAVEA
jgi:Na+/H+ antiporter NhaC